MSDPAQQDIYYDLDRPEVMAFIPSDARSAIDIGCGRGGFGRSLRATLGPDARLVGVEPVATQAAHARVDHGFDEVLTGYYPEAMASSTERFDLVVFNDVLEHLVDPWGMLDGLHDRLTEGGRVLACVPSIRYLPVMWQLVRGRWDYTADGTLDRTHLRFFTKATMVELFERTGYEVASIDGVNSLFAQRPWRRRRYRWLRRFTGETHWLQYVVVGRSMR